MSATKGNPRTALRTQALTEQKDRDPLQLYLKHASNDTGKGSADLFAEGVGMNATALRSAAALFMNTPSGNVDMTELMASVAREAKEVEDGNLAHLEGMMASQAITLNGVFTAYMVKAVAAHGTAAGEVYMRAALRAQAQSRATFETLVYAKNPPSAVIAKQANITNGPQQVVNGSVPDVQHLGTVQKSLAPARTAQIESAPIKLLEADGSGEILERVDGPAPKAASEGNPSVAAVAVLNRPKVRRRKTASGAQRLQRRGAATATRGNANTRITAKGAR